MRITRKTANTGTSMDARLSVAAAAVSTAEMAGFARVKFATELIFAKAVFGEKADCYRLDVAGGFDLTETVFHSDAIFATSRFGGLVRANDDPRSSGLERLRDNDEEFNSLLIL